MPELARRNTQPLLPLARGFEQIGQEKGYDDEDLLGAVIAMVQTSLFYRIPPSTEGQRKTGGVLPPLQTLTLGWGDCDTKTALMASILMNWDQMRAVGVGLPGHYLLGIRRTPGRGDAYVEYEESTYVLVEPAGPAWLPMGSVSPETLTMLESAERIAIDPFWMEKSI